MLPDFWLASACLISYTSFEAMADDVKAELLGMSVMPAAHIYFGEAAYEAFAAIELSGVAVESLSQRGRVDYAWDLSRLVIGRRYTDAACFEQLKARIYEALSPEDVTLFIAYASQSSVARVYYGTTVFYCLDRDALALDLLTPALLPRVLRERWYARHAEACAKITQSRPTYSRL